MMRKIIGPIALAAALFANASTASAAPIFIENFDLENGGNSQLNYTAFAQFTITDGSVDLIGCTTAVGCDANDFDFLPGNGLYVDLDGTTRNAGIQTADATALDAGTYTLSFDLAGSQRGSSGSIENVRVTVFSSGGTIAFWDLIRLSPQGFIRENLLFALATSESVQFSFENAGGDNVGALLDNVELSSTDAAPIPEPGSMMLLGTGLFGLAGAARRRFQRKA